MATDDSTLRAADLFASTEGLRAAANELDKKAAAHTDVAQHDELIAKATELRNAIGKLAVDALNQLIDQNKVAVGQISEAIEKTNRTLKRIAKAADALTLATQVLGFFGALLTGNVGKIVSAGGKLSEATKKFDKKYPPAPAAVIAAPAAGPTSP